MRLVIRYNLAIVLLVMAMAGAPSGHAQLIEASFAVDPALYITAPSNDTNGSLYSRDYYRHFQVKAYRDSAYVASIKNTNYEYNATSQYTLLTYYINYHLKFFQPAFGLQLSRTVNKELCFFLDSCRISSYNVVSRIPATWSHIRPFVSLREGHFGFPRSALSYVNNYPYAPSSSFPSNESTFGWLTGIVMSCLNPWSGDSLAIYAHRHGWFREVSGGSWHSDIENSRLMGTATFAQLMSMPQFRERLLTMRRQTATLLNIVDSTYRTTDDLLTNETLLNQAASHLFPGFCESDGGFQSDMWQYMQLSSLVDSLPASAPFNATYIGLGSPSTAFEDIIQMNIDPNKTPFVYQLVNTLEQCCEQLCTRVQAPAQHARRPYELFNTHPITTEFGSELINGVSLHASKSMARAFALMMLVPERRDTLLQMGYQYGMYRVIGGVDWYSEFEAGRSIANMAFALLASCGDFVELVGLAQDEYNYMQDPIITDLPGIAADAPETDQHWFTIDGRRATPSSRGVIVGRDQKILKP